MVAIELGGLDTLGARAARAAPAHRYAIISDETVAGLYASRVAASFTEPVEVFTVPAGEQYKTREQWGRLTDELLARGFARDTTIVALGGGVVGDLAGFVAATYMRGVPVVQAPTTLLAMIDASIGGKTGVDTAAGKNLVGAFHQPSAVIIDPAVLASLPPRHLRAGLAEAIKHGVIADAAYFERTVDAIPALLAAGGAESAAMMALIEGSVAIKRDVVARDEREAGVRRILNFGHTIGHAVETLSGYALLHGEAVAIGMAVESRLAERLGEADRGTAGRVCAALTRAALPVAVPALITAQAVVESTHADKKVRRGRVEYALPRTIGAMAGRETRWGIAVGDDDIMTTLSGMNHGH